MNTVVRIHPDKTIEVNEIYEVLPGFDDEVQIDDTYQLDKNWQFDEGQEAEEFLEKMFNIKHTLVDVKDISFDIHGNVFAKEFIEGDDFTLNRDGRFVAKEFKEGF